MIANIIRNAKKIVTDGDPYYSAVSLLLPMDGTNGSTTFTDSSLNGLTVTAVGNTQISTTQSKYGGASGYFDGTGDYLSLPSNSIFAIGTTDFTVEFWIYITARKAYGYVLSTQGGTNGLYISFDAAGNYLRLTNDTTVYAISSTLNLNQWYQVAVVRSNGSSKIYVDGVGGTAVACSTIFVQSGPLIGGTASANYFQGYIDDLRISLFARYVSNFTPPTAALPTTASSTPADPYYGYTSLLLHMDGTNASTNFVDSGPNALAVTASGSAQISTAQSKFGGASGSFDGSTDRITAVTTNSTFTGDFTWECWFYPTSDTNTYKALFSAGSETTGRYVLLQYGSNIVVDLYAVSQNINVSCGITANSGWHHVALVRSGTTVTLYYDGVSKATATRSGTVGNTNGFFCGNNSAGTNPYNGYIDDLRVTKYARYTSAFTPPTQAHPNA